jgi:O-acetyl-ADP-ribose deacetylase (regulator of RNase III)
MTMTPIRYLTGDATDPQAAGPKIVAHVCNDLGGWGKGFVVAVSARWPQPEADYRAWHKAGAGGGFALGAVRFVPVRADIVVANMIGQHGIKTGSKGSPIRYEAIDAALARVAEKAVELGASVHMPRIGCGLAGGKWERVEPLVARNLAAHGVAVTVYDFG